MSSRTSKQRLLALSLAAIPIGCSIFGGDHRPAYQKAGETEPLEVPPGLSEPAADSRMQIPSLDGERVSAVETLRLARQPETAGGYTQSTAAPANAVLPRFAGMRVRRAGGVRWLEVDADAAALWPKLRDFWRQAGIEVVRTEPQLGTMQTAWIEPREGALTAEALRDSFRLRVERQDADTTNVYITHRSAARTGGDNAARWAPRSSDPGLEAEYITRLMVYLGESQREAERQLAAADGEANAMHLDRVAGIPVLVVKDQFRDVWPLTGVALDRAGLPVEEEDVGAGTYYFRYQPAVGETEAVLAGLPGSGNSARLHQNGRYQVHLLDQPGQTLITAHAERREALAPAAAEEILTRLIASMQNGVANNGARLGTLSATPPGGA
jgi:outer membrane protein assembly factor BamC